MENFRNKQFLSFKLWSSLSSWMKSQAVCSFPPRSEWFLFEAHPAHLSSLSSCLSPKINCLSMAVLMFGYPLFYLMAPQCKSTYACNLDMPKRNQSFSFPWMVKILHLMKKEKYCVVQSLSSKVRTDPLCVKL